MQIQYISKTELSKFMLKIVLIFTCLSISYSLSINAQNRYLGVRGGINYAQIRGDAPVYEESRAVLGVNLGGIYERKYTKRISLQVELLYSQQGFNYEYSTEPPQVIQTIIDGTVNYFHAPVCGRLYVSKAKKPKVDFFIFGGGYFALLAQAKSETRVTFNTPTISDLFEDYKSYDVGATGGVGIIFNIRLHKIYVEYRYTHSLLSIDNTGDVPNLVNKISSINIGLLFPYW